jgi:hypothetical protein
MKTNEIAGSLEMKILNELKEKGERSIIESTAANYHALLWLRQNRMADFEVLSGATHVLSSWAIS